MGLDGTVETALDRRAKVRVDGAQQERRFMLHQSPASSARQSAWSVLASRGQVHFSAEAGFLKWHVRCSAVPKGCAFSCTPLPNNHERKENCLQREPSCSCRPWRPWTPASPSFMPFLSTWKAVLRPSDILPDGQTKSRAGPSPQVSLPRIDCSFPWVCWGNLSPPPSRRFPWGLLHTALSPQGSVLILRGNSVPALSSSHFFVQQIRPGIFAGFSIPVF